MTANPIVSIITPAYNRGTLLQNCYESLLRQTNKNFEWIIVDDGSKDDTKEKVTSFYPDFPLQYVYKDNGGKHTALNASHDYIQGKYVLILDSDDYLVDDAIEQVIKGWNTYDMNPEIGMVIWLKGETIDDPSCRAEDENIPVDFMRYRRTIIHSNDCCEVIRSELFKKYPFPVFEGEKFISEGALWNRVSFTHKVIYINSVIYIAHYLEGGLSKSGRPLRIHNPNGGMYTANLNMNKKNYLDRRIKNGLLYTSYGFFAGKSPLQMAENCDSKALMWLCLPGGWALYHYWYKKYY